MKHLFISLLILWGIFQLSSLIGPSKGSPPSTTFTRLIEPPQHRLIAPSENGYFYLLGFAAAISLDPAKVGYEIWLETNAASGRSDFNYNKPDRSELQLPLPIEQVLPSWNTENPVREFQNLSRPLQPLTGHDHTLLMRYEQWLTMPFEDMGFGHQGTPRFAEMLVAHRLYIADGFSRQTTLGMERLKKDIRMWRSVLQQATTIATKVMAQIVVTDNLRLLATLLSQPAVDKTVLAMSVDIARPLTPAESSLRWPLQHEFALGVQGGHRDERTTNGQPASLNTNERWVAKTAHLPEQAFRRIAHPHGASFLGLPLQTRETWETYATYYDALIHAAEAGRSTLPTLHELTDATSQGIVESLVSRPLFEPDWNPFLIQLKETDARLRLASLQIVLRRPSAQTSVPNRLAEVGSSYYDPFSGLPMLWSSTQQKIYSVGKDRFDDGGDAGFDISVPVLVATKPAPTEAPSVMPTRRTNRR